MTGGFFEDVNVCMKKFAFIFLLIFILPSVVSARWKKLPVLVYHHIQDPAKSDVSCTPKQFESQIQAIIDEGYTPLTLSQIRKYLAGGLKQIVLPVAITFDDGYESLYKYALPIAKKLKVPMSVFVITYRIGKKPQFTQYLSISETREMSDSNYFQFGSHSNDLHTDIIRIFNSFASYNNPVEKLVRRDLRLSYRKLKIITGKKPIALAWPYGKYNNTTTKIARDVGFKLHFTSNFGYNEVGGNPFAIKRIPVSARDNVKSVLKKIRGY